MVKRELFEPGIAQPVHATVADVADERAAGRQHQRTDGRSHAAEIVAGHSLGVNLGIGFHHGVQQGFGRGAADRLVVRQLNDVGGEFAGQFTRRVGAHPVGDDEQMAALVPFFLAAGEHDGQGILVVRAPQTDVAKPHEVQTVFPDCGVRVHARWSARQ